jgi:hypothetical protein
MKELELPWTKLNRATTDGAPSMIGKKTDFMGKIKREVDKEDTEFYMEFHCIIHQQSLCEKALRSNTRRKFWCRL